jgi:hypothetical protein
VRGRLGRPSDQRQQGHRSDGFVTPDEDQCVAALGERLGQPPVDDDRLFTFRIRPTSTVGRHPD